MFFTAQIPAQKHFRLYLKIKTNTCRIYLSPNQINKLINKAGRLQLFPWAGIEGERRAERHLWEGKQGSHWGVWGERRKGENKERARQRRRTEKRKKFEWIKSHKREGEDTIQRETESERVRGSSWSTERYQRSERDVRTDAGRRQKREGNAAWYLSTSGYRLGGGPPGRRRPVIATQKHCRPSHGDSGMWGIRGRRGLGLCFSPGASSGTETLHTQEGHNNAANANSNVLYMTPLLTHKGHVLSKHLAPNDEWQFPFGGRIELDAVSWLWNKDSFKSLFKCFSKFQFQA